MAQGQAPAHPAQEDAGLPADLHAGDLLLPHQVRAAPFASPSEASKMLAVLLRSGGRPDITNGILQYITDQDDGYGIDIDPCAQTPLRNRPTDQGDDHMRTRAGTFSTATSPPTSACPTAISQTSTRIRSWPWPLCPPLDGST